MNPSSSKNYIPAVDGLRALGVLAVLLYHLHLPFAKSGLLGVTVFFVISGYLVTMIMLRENDKMGGVDLRNFWERRALRILPNMVAMILVMSLVFAFANPYLLTKMRPDILPSVLLANNWWQIFHDVSYFQAQGAPSPLTHCWSLAIEGQFYLVWPLVLILLYRLSKSDRLPLAVTILIAIASMAMMIWLYDPLMDGSRAYYGTDSRCFSLLMGAAFAIARHGGFEGFGERSKAVAHILGGISLAGLLALMVFVNSYSRFLYWGGQQLTSLLALLLLASVLQEDGLWSRIFGFGPLVFVGKMSYSLYLWHYPIILLFSGGLRATWPITLLETVLSFVVAGLFYAFLEKPFRKGLLGKIYSRIRYGSNHKAGAPVSSYRIRKAKLTAAGMGLLLVAAVAALIITPSTDTQPTYWTKYHVGQAPAASQPFGLKMAQGTNPTGEAEELLESMVQKADILVIGDSVVVDATGPLNETFENIIVDAEIGRHAQKAHGIYDDYVKKGWDGEVVVYALATNGPVQDTLAEMREYIGKDRIMIVINARGPYDPWTPDNNKQIAAFVVEHENTYQLDWYGYSEGHEDWLEPDGTHLRPEGAKAYRDMLWEGLIRIYRSKGVTESKDDAKE